MSVAVVAESLTDAVADNIYLGLGLDLSFYPPFDPNEGVRVGAAVVEGMGLVQVGQHV